MNEQPLLRIEVAYAAPDIQAVIPLELPVGATVADALAAVCDRQPFAKLNLDQHDVGIYGQLVDSNRKLADEDRVELYRPLAADPKTLRRKRASSSC